MFMGVLKSLVAQTSDLVDVGVGHGAIKQNDQSQADRNLCDRQCHHEFGWGI